MVMDDLSVMLMSTISSSITLFNKFHVKEVSSLQERVVELGLDHVINKGKFLYLTLIFVIKKN
ncbi:hypothetical protein QJS04_geneDACA022808 [Acorus gramineus]|uniref:Uncharacterized protein n=1 Tax=Acorus gramineus TaxID=55184 RepID=A0AAV9B0J4_ACOGR|nr:hypothetical protein QJS04_geneDACA022808 [Acorus gramineus]